MESVTARLHTPVMYVECPECQHDFDLFDTDDCYETANSDDGQPIAWRIFQTWNDNKNPEEEITCPVCDKKILINKVEY